MLVGSLPLWLDVAVIAAVGGFLLLAWLGGLLDTFRRGGQADESADNYSDPPDHGPGA